MKVAVYPGSFDPATNGHMDIIERACKLVDVLIVGVLHNPDKTPYLSLEQRVELLKKLTKNLDNVIFIIYILTCTAEKIIICLKVFVDAMIEMYCTVIK